MKRNSKDKVTSVKQNELGKRVPSRPSRASITEQKDTRKGRGKHVGASISRSVCTFPTVHMEEGTKNVCRRSSTVGNPSQGRKPVTAKLKPKKNFLKKTGTKSGKNANSTSQAINAHEAKSKKATGLKPKIGKLPKPKPTSNVKEEYVGPSIENNMSLGEKPSPTDQALLKNYAKLPKPKPRSNVKEEYVGPNIENNGGLEEKPSPTDQVLLKNYTKHLMSNQKKIISKENTKKVNGGLCSFICDLIELSNNQTCIDEDNLQDQDTLSNRSTNNSLLNSGNPDAKSNRNYTYPEWERRLRESNLRQRTQALEAHAERTKAKIEAIEFKSTRPRSVSPDQAQLNLKESESPVFDSTSSHADEEIKEWTELSRYRPKQVSPPTNLLQAASGSPVYVGESFQKQEKECFGYTEKKPGKPRQASTSAYNQENPVVEQCPENIKPKPEYAPRTHLRSDGNKSPVCYERPNEHLSYGENKQEKPRRAVTICDYRKEPGIKETQATETIKPRKDNYKFKSATIKQAPPTCTELRSVGKKSPVFHEISNKQDKELSYGENKHENPRRAADSNDISKQSFGVCDDRERVDYSYGGHSKFMKNNRNQKNVREIVKAHPMIEPVATFLGSGKQGEDIRFEKRERGETIKKSEPAAMPAKIENIPYSSPRYERFKKGRKHDITSTNFASETGSLNSDKAVHEDYGHSERFQYETSKIKSEVPCSYNNHIGWREPIIDLSGGSTMSNIKSIESSTVEITTAQRWGEPAYFDTDSFHKDASTPRYSMDDESTYQHSLTSTYPNSDTYAVHQSVLSKDHPDVPLQMTPINHTVTESGIKASKVSRQESRMPLDSKKRDYERKTQVDMIELTSPFLKRTPPFKGFQKAREQKSPTSGLQKHALNKSHPVKPYESENINSDQSVQGKVPRINSCMESCQPGKDRESGHSVIQTPDMSIRLTATYPSEDSITNTTRNGSITTKSNDPVNTSTVHSLEEAKKRSASPKSLTQQEGYVRDDSRAVKHISMLKEHTFPKESTHADGYLPQNRFEQLKHSETTDTFSRSTCKTKTEKLQFGNTGKEQALSFFRKGIKEQLKHNLSTGKPMTVINKLCDNLAGNVYTMTDGLLDSNYFRIVRDKNDTTDQKENTYSKTYDEMIPSNQNESTSLDTITNAQQVNKVMRTSAPEQPMNNLVADTYKSAIEKLPDSKDLLSSLPSDSKFTPPQGKTLDTDPPADNFFLSSPYEEIFTRSVVNYKSTSPGIKERFTSPVADHMPISSHKTWDPQLQSPSSPTPDLSPSSENTIIKFLRDEEDSIDDLKPTNGLVFYTEETEQQTINSLNATKDLIKQSQNLEGQLVNLLGDINQTQSESTPARRDYVGKWKRNFDSWYEQPGGGYDQIKAKWKVEQEKFLKSKQSEKMTKADGTTYEEAGASPVRRNSQRKFKGSKDGRTGKERHVLLERIPEELDHSLVSSSDNGVVDVDHRDAEVIRFFEAYNVLFSQVLIDMDKKGLMLRPRERHQMLTGPEETKWFFSFSKILEDRGIPRIRIHQLLIGGDFQVYGCVGKEVIKSLISEVGTVFDKYCAQYNLGKYFNQYFKDRVAKVQQVQPNVDVNQILALEKVRMMKQLVSMNLQPFKDTYEKFRKRMLCEDCFTLCLEWQTEGLDLMDHDPDMVHSKIRLFRMLSKCGKGDSQPTETRSVAINTSHPRVTYKEPRALMRGKKIHRTNAEMSVTAKERSKIRFYSLKATTP